MFKEKTAIVTGASRGIGKAIAEALEQAGACVFKTSSATCDVADYNACEEFVKNVGKVDILVNNAGITRDKLLLKMEKSDFDDVVNTNLGGVFNMTKAVTPIMMKARAGRIINISSVMGLVGNAGQANYCASKAGIIGFTKAVAKELGARGITVNAIAPGFIQTDMTDTLPEQIKEEYVKKIPLKRMGTPEDIANAVLFLASENASYITGQILVVDGGLI